MARRQKKRDRWLVGGTVASHGLGCCSRAPPADILISSPFVVVHYILQPTAAIRNNSECFSIVLLSELHSETRLIAQLSHLT